MPDALSIWNQSLPYVRSLLQLSDEGRAQEAGRLAFPRFFSAFCARIYTIKLWHSQICGTPLFFLMIQLVNSEVLITLLKPGLALWALLASMCIYNCGLNIVSIELNETDSPSFAIFLAEISNLSIMPTLSVSSFRLEIAYSEAWLSDVF